MTASRNKVLLHSAIGVASAAAVALLYLTGALERLEMWSLDFRFNCAPRWQDAASPADIAIVTVDQNSVETVHQRLQQRWPWPRQFHGKVIDYATAGGARAVVYDIFFTEPDINRMDISTEESDAALEQATARSGKVFHTGVLQRRALPPPEDEWSALSNRLATLPLHVSPAAEIPSYNFAALPSAPLQKASRGFGFANVAPEGDSVVRRMPLLMRVKGTPAMSLALAVAWDLSGRPPMSYDGRVFRIGDWYMQTDGRCRVWLSWFRPPETRESPFVYYSAAAVLRSAVKAEMGRLPEVPAGVFSNKIVFVATTAPGTFDVRATPLRPDSPGVEVQATALANLLRNVTLTRVTPLQALLLALAIALAVGLVCRDSRHVWLGGAITALLLAATAVAGWFALVRWHWFVDLVPAMTAGVVTFTAVTFTNYLSQRRHAQLVKRIFEHYLDSSVVSRLIGDPAQVRLGGERREATVLFCDVANFTTTSESLTPENLVRFMNLYLDAMTDIIIEQGGFVDKFVGDEIVAIFGAPNPTPDHAARACEAVVLMREKLLTMQDEFRAMGCGTEVFGRTGLNTGPMVVGNMGSQSRMNYTAMGDTVNLGARLEGTTKIYGVRTIVGEGTATAVRGLFALRELDLVRVKGKNRAVPVFELVGRAGQVKPDVEARMAAFAEALALYRARRFAEALRGFEANAAAGDLPSLIFAGRCREYMAAPPPPDWDGSYTMLTK